MEENKKTNKVARLTGTICGTVMCGCALSILIALTIKLIMWMF